jgi:hypothetical protein
VSKLASLLVVSFLFVQQSVWSQNLPPILKANKPKRGIYLSFDEFLNNAPSIQSEFELTTRSKGTLGGKVYKLILKKSDPLKKKAYKFWGVSTGDSAYVNVANYQAAEGYIKLLSLGRYCYTKGITSLTYRDPGAAVVLGGGMLAGTIINLPREAGYILNINTGNFYMLHRDNMTKILSKDGELLSAYSAEEEKNKKDADVMLSYIERYNQRHPEQIGRKEKLAKVTLYRREKKERKDTVNIVTGDSLQYSMEPGAITAITTAEKMITLCAGEECKDFNLVVDAMNYIECSYKEGNPRIQLIPQEKKVGEFYAREVQIIIDKRQGD